MPRSPTPKKDGGKHTKYIPMLSPNVLQGVEMKPGRHICHCEASKHALINNCLHCGRIVCEQEGSGPCFTCNNLVCTPEEQEVISRQTKSSMKLYNALMSDQTSGKVQETKILSLKNALEHRNKLLECDKNVEKRAKIIDDENDYFEVDSNRWLSEKEKKVLRKKKAEINEALHGKKKATLTFDFAGRKIIEEKPAEIKVNIEELLNTDTSIFACEDKSALDVPSNYKPAYEQALHIRSSANLLNEAEQKVAAMRIQDPELQGMSDDGMCLSLHQPYASLLAAGIKKHEGRIWYTNYRGRLWVHAAGKTPTKQEIKDVEYFYSSKGQRAFPENYPPGCLLGCVDLVDCLPQEEYREMYPDGESGSPYVFLCENAQELTIKFPMKGQHKIFKIDSKILQAAKKTLKKKM